MIVGHWATQRHYSVAQWLRRWTEWHVPVKRVWNPLWANGRYSASWNAAVYRLWKKKWCVYYLCSVMWNNVWKLNRTASTNKVTRSHFLLQTEVCSSHYFASLRSASNNHLSLATDWAETWWWSQPSSWKNRHHQRKPWRHMEGKDKSVTDVTEPLGI